MKQKIPKSALMEEEIQDLTSYVEDLALQIDAYKKQIVFLQTELPAQKTLEEKEAEVALQQAPLKDPIEQEWQDLLEDNRQEILYFMQLKKLTNNIEELEEETCFSAEEIKILLATNESHITRAASCLLGIPFDACQEWPLLAGGSDIILPGGGQH